MRFLLLLMAFGCLMARATARPPQVDEIGVSEEEEAVYGDGAASEELRSDGDDAPENEQESANEEDEGNQNQGSQEFARNAVGEKNSRTINDNCSEKSSETEDEKADEALHPDKQYETLLQHRQARYNENNDANDEGQSAQHLTNHNINNIKLQQNDDSLVNKGILGSRTTSNEEGDYLFETNENRDQVNKAAIKAYNGIGDPRRYKQYYKSAQAENEDNKSYEKLNMYANRDRRQAQESTPKYASNASNTPTKIEDIENSATEDEEAAIKRHVRKLSGEELEELLNSLSQDKRELLKKIMENDNEENKDMINKREITKKAGAVEEDSLDNLQSNSNLQEGSSSIDINIGTSSPGSGSTDPNKVPDTTTDINDLTATKSGITSSGLLNLEVKAEAMKGIDEHQDSMSSFAPIKDPKNLVSGDQNIQCTTKINNKREANYEDVSNVDLSFDNKILENDFSYQDTKDLPNDQGYFCPQNDDFAQPMEYESQLHNGNGNKAYKRDILSQKHTDLSDSIKSLEESFPNSNAYDDANPYADSAMAPLIRVKRRNEELAMKKRAAGLMPDAKVAYFPYRAENDDEDTDEGNEFDDDGLYDRTSSLSKNNANDKPDPEESANNCEMPSRHLKSVRRNSQSNIMNRSKLSRTDNMMSDISLGSDNDNVLSGVEGVDENLMFSNGARNRRTPGNVDKVDGQAIDSDIKQNRALRSTPFMDEEMKTPSENYINAPKYQESDAFGPLPHNSKWEKEQSILNKWRHPYRTFLHVHALDL